MTEGCPTPVYHDTHRYCPSCDWNEELTFPEVDTSDLANLRRKVEAQNRDMPVGTQEDDPMAAERLTENDPQPDVGARIIDAWEVVWERQPEGYWLPISDHYDEPTSWVQLAGNYGPVTLVSESNDG